MEIKKRWEWDHYLWWMEETDTIMIKHRNGAVSYVPKTPETTDVIAFMKTKVKPKPLSS
jgi:hypothetical protein